MNGRTAKLLRKTAAAEAHWQKSGTKELPRYFAFAYKHMKHAWVKTPFKRRHSLRVRTKQHLARLLHALVEAQGPRK